MNLISLENLFQAWDEFKKGKRNKKDVQEFEFHLEDNLFGLYESLKNKTYKHGYYEDFYVIDPKRRHIHKAKVSDRILHHLLYTYLYQLFDKTFIFDSYSCRLEKGTHKAVKRLEQFSRKVSKNYARDCWALKLDIKKFFANVNHKILLSILEEKIEDQDTLNLLEEVIESFHSANLASQGQALQSCNGIPLGNLTSQIFANIYMNELDQFVKQKLKIKYYIRYADDFIILDSNKDNLYKYTSILVNFLDENLKLELHPNKIILRKLSWGIDFLGYIVLPHYILPRTKTKKRIIKRILKERISNQSLQSYLGYLKHANTYRLRENLKAHNWICLSK